MCLSLLLYLAKLTIVTMPIKREQLKTTTKVGFCAMLHNIKQHCIVFPYLYLYSRFWIHLYNKTDNLYFKNISSRHYAYHHANNNDAFIFILLFIYLFIFYFIFIYPELLMAVHSYTFN